MPLRRCRLRDQVAGQFEMSFDPRRAGPAAMDPAMWRSAELELRAPVANLVITSVLERRSEIGLRTV